MTAPFLPDPIKLMRTISPRLRDRLRTRRPKTAIRASFGPLLRSHSLRATSNALQRDGSKFIVAQLSPTQPGAPVFSKRAVGPTATATRPNITRIDPNIEGELQPARKLQIERELPANTIVSVGYLRLRARHLILSKRERAYGSPSAGIPVQPSDPNWGNISRFESSGNSS